MGSVRVVRLVASASSSVGCRRRRRRGASASVAAAAAAACALSTAARRDGTRPGTWSPATAARLAATDSPPPSTPD